MSNSANHLISEKSPYLQQHAHNPVDWYPWGQAAFEKARAEDKPIFLSVGYSTCHWCHVMERESFESEELAAIMNRWFVPVKVDREERPDVDRIYMTFVQASTGGGGWPMSVFLTPELKPFFGGTYFPPDNRYGRPGFGAILERIAEAWRNERGRIVQSSGDVVAQLSQHAGAAGPSIGIPDKTTLDSAFQQFRRMYDSAHGGFGSAPKFPRPVVFNFLLRYFASTNRQEALEMTLGTLRAMANGGMHDQLGGGFHRYSVDERWFVPHFEKMLYDQAQLAISYLEAFQITHDPFHAKIARSTLDYVLQDMTHPEGGFYSAEDADSVIDPRNPKEKGEGAFYIWTAVELKEALGEEQYQRFASIYGVEANGNVPDDPHGEFIGKNILYLRESLHDAADDAAEAELTASKRTLLAIRSKRVRPHLDDKILTAWNGLMISAFAKGAQILDDPRYLTAAQRAASFVLTRMYDANSGVLLRRYRDGDAAIPGFLDDYAFFIGALLDLYEADFNARHMETAIQLTSKMRELFEDTAGGAFFSTAEGDNNLVLRMKDDYDGAEPSGNAVALFDLLKLAHFTDRAEYRDAAERTLRALGSKMAQHTAAVPEMLAGLDYYLAPRREIVIAGEPREFLQHIRARFLPHTITLLSDAPFVSWAGSMREIDGQGTAYVCQKHACQLPTNQLANFDELLQ